MFTSFDHFRKRLSRFQPPLSQYRRSKTMEPPFVLLLLVILLLGLSGLVFAVPKCQAAEVPVFLPGGGIYTKAVASYKERRMEKVVPQSADFSCGAAAIATLCHYVFGQEINEKDAILGMFKHGDKDEIRQRGFSMLDMKKFALSRGLQAQGYKIKDINLLKQMNVPVITIIQTGKYKHFVVLRKVDDNFAYISDPSWGNRKMVLRDFINNWDKVILVLTGSCQGTPEGLYCEAEELPLPKRWVLRNEGLLGHRFAMDPTLAIYTVTRVPSYGISDLVGSLPTTAP